MSILTYKLCLGEFKSGVISRLQLYGNLKTYRRLMCRMKIPRVAKKYLKQVQNLNTIS